MNKTEYQKQKSKIEEHIKSLIEEKEILKEKYIKSNQEFCKGQRVIITDVKGRRHIGFVSYISVDNKGGFNYRFLKCKKDGNPSKHELWVFRINDIKAFN